mmetsp:Transcript_4718/g.8579  ORF Transcript_4718/g.8579 Transcript_4718/m.8579 type:complete len:405 (+) Transcript_4718:398-1612(+)
MVHPRFFPVHQGADLQVELLLAVALPKHLLLQRLHPPRVLLRRQHAVPQVRHLHRHLQRHHPLVDVHRRKRLATRLPPHRLRVHHLSPVLHQQLKVAAHIGGQHHSDHGALKLLRLPRLPLLYKVILRLRHQRERGAQAVVLRHRLKVKRDSHRLLRLHQKPVGQLRVLKVVGAGSDDGGQQLAALRGASLRGGADAAVAKDAREAVGHVSGMEAVVVATLHVAALKAAREGEEAQDGLPCLEAAVQLQRRHRLLHHNHQGLVAATHHTVRVHKVQREVQPYAVKARNGHLHVLWARHLELVSVDVDDIDERDFEQLAPVALAVPGAVRGLLPRDGGVRGAHTARAVRFHRHFPVSRRRRRYARLVQQVLRHAFRVRRVPVQTEPQASLQIGRQQVVGFFDQLA